MNNTDLAEFYGVTDRAVRKWSPERKHRKRVQALSGAEQPICDLIADINNLAYIYDCQWLHGVEQVKQCKVSRHPSHMGVALFEKTEPHPVREWIVWMHHLNAFDQLNELKIKLEELVYGQV